MGTTLSLIFRRLATKFSNLVQKKNPPGPRAELVTTNCVATNCVATNCVASYSYLKERTIVNTIDFRVVGPIPTRPIPGYATGFRYVDLK